MPCDQSPKQSNRNHGEDERRGKKIWREEEKAEEKLEEEQEKEEKEENEVQNSQKKLVSKPLMDTLWATFKLNNCPTIGNSLSLAFEFGMTGKQV